MLKLLLPRLPRRVALAYGCGMKRILFTLALTAWLVSPPGARAQNLVNDAIRQELDERLRRVERDLESMKETTEALRKKLADVQRNAATVEESAAKAAVSAKNILQTTASKDELHQLRDALKESERRRIEDQKRLTEMLERLQKELTATPPPPVPSTSRQHKSKSESSGGKAAPVPAGVPDTGVYHLVEKNQTALEILKAYNDDQKAKGKPGKITLKQLEAANPNVNMDRLRAGQKLFIPIPDK